MSTPTPILQYSLSTPTMQSLLPAEYTPLVYIESSGTQYIDTGKILASSDIIYTKVCWTQIVDASLFSSKGNATWTAGKYLGITYYSNNKVFYSFGSARSSTGTPTQFPVNANQLYEITFKPTAQQCIVNGTTYTGSNSAYTQTTDSFTCANNMFLFAANSAGTATQLDKAKVYRFTASGSDGTLKLDLRPARRDSDGVIGMYDLVSRSFKTNSGSGTFIAGPPLAVGKGGGKSLPEEYQQVEYIGTTHASGTVYPVYRKSDMVGGTYDVSSGAFTSVSGTIGPSVTTAYTWEPNAGSGTQQGLYTNLSSVYDSSKGWVGDFNGSSSAIVSSADLVSIFNSRVWSIALWFNADVLSSDEQSTNWKRLLAYCNPSDLNSTKQVVLFLTKTSIGTSFYIDDTSKIISGLQTGKWYHVVITQNGATQTIYVNGVSLGTNTKGAQSIPSGAQLSIGCRYNTSPLGAFDGKLYNIQIFNTTLTDAQIKELYGQ